MLDICVISLKKQVPNMLPDLVPFAAESEKSGKREKRLDL